MLEILKTILLGIVEGITEWLPVSSTGHLIILDEILHLNVSPEFMEMFRVVIQLGAILAVVLVYFQKIWPFRFREARTEGGSVFVREKWILWAKILVSCVPAILIGLPFDDWLDEKLYNPWVVAVMLIVYGVGFICIENAKRKKPHIRRAEEIGWKEAALIGVFQVLALIPGTSRSGATILGGMLIGLSRRAAAEYTFYLGIPVMFGASFLKLVKYGLHYSAAEAGYLLVGVVVSFFVSLLTIRFLMNYIRRHDFKVFGWYRIALGIAVLLFFWLR